MSSFLEYAQQFVVKENVAIDTFLTALQKQREAFKKGDLNRRSWVKAEGAGFLVTLGKLDNTYSIGDKDAVLMFLDKAADAARREDDFKAAIEKAYGAAPEAPKRGRRKKGSSGTGIGNG